MGKRAVSRRNFMGGMAAAVGYLSTRSSAELWAQGGPAAVAAQRARGPMSPEQYDRMVKISSNENNWGPPESVMKAMNNAWKYVGRYGYPDGDIIRRIAEHHGVKPENILLGAGSGEILDVVGTTFLIGGKKVLGVDPSYGFGLPARHGHQGRFDQGAAERRLQPGHQRDDRAGEQARQPSSASTTCATRTTRRVVVVPKQEVKQIVDSLPKDMPILIDEAYHHFVNTPNYETAIPFVLEGRPVIVARTFSKIAGLAAMRLGYAVAPAANHPADAPVRDEQHQRAGEARRRGLAAWTPRRRPR